MKKKKNLLQKKISKENLEFFSLDEIRTRIADFTVGWNEFFFICSYDEACLVVRESPAFLAFEGHKGRKAKKGQKIFFSK